MGELQTVEDKIKAEWSWLKAKIATNPYIAVGVAFVLGVVVKAIF